MDKITFITTTYNHQAYIDATIQSIIDQEYENWELLIGDDSPDDATWNIIQNFLKKYPKNIYVWKHQPSKGIVDNMNFLIKKVSSNTQYIVFLEGDDTIEKGYVQEKIKIFHKYPKVKMVYNNINTINAEGKTLERNAAPIRSYIQNETCNIKYTLLGNYQSVTYSTLMIQKDILSKIHLFKNDDTSYLTSFGVFFNEIAHKYHIYGLNKSLTNYRKHGENNSKNSTKMIKDIIEGKKYLVKKYNLEDNSNIQYRISFLEICMKILDGKKQDVIKYCFYSFKYSFTKNIIIRIGILFLYILPIKKYNFLHKKIIKNI